MGSTIAVARANWDIVEVRDLGGTLLMRDEVPEQNGLLFHQRMRFAGARYLIVEIGGGVTAAGFRAWDFVEQRWAMSVSDHWDDVALVGVDAARALVAVSDGKGVDVFEVATGNNEWRMPLCSVESIDFNPDNPDLVVAGGDSFMFNDGDLPGAPLMAVFVRSRLTHRRASSALSYDGPQLAWLDAEQIVHLSPHGELELVGADLGTVRSLGTHAGRGSDLRVAEARWIVLHTGTDTTLVDTTGRLPAKTTPGFVAVMPGGEGTICADTHSVTMHRW
ncbi:hypothetical protein WME79_48080 [Sorangium sp. So ce726]|uniref:hypothetical protein n=1 Tax=Sorangium sp. So ce726 TaxID=3133319 RepID=UPI003F5DE16F